MKTKTTENTDQKSSILSIEETKALRKAYSGIRGGLEMLVESKTKSLGALAKIGIILMDNNVRERHSLEYGECEIQELLGKIHFLLTDLNKASVKTVNSYLNDEIEKLETKAN